MRCLYCGKELPLFKRLRGGEFCSDAHRLRYQEEYTQLALNRLLQANTSTEPDDGNAKGPPAAKSKDSKTVAANPPANSPMELESPALKRRERLAREETPSPSQTLPSQTLPSHTLVPAASVAADPESPVLATAVAEAPQPVALLEPEPLPPEPAPEEPPPAAMWGYLVEIPLPVTVDAPAIVKSETDMVSLLGPPILPRMQGALPVEPESLLNDAGPIAQPRSIQADTVAPPRERALEVREFVRSLPLAQIQLAPAGEVGLPASYEVLEVRLDPQPPQGTPRLWEAADREFAIPVAELGEMARLDFETTGWAESQATSAEPNLLNQNLLNPNLPQAPPQPRLSAPVRIDPFRFEPVPVERARREPVHFEPVRIEPVFMERVAVPVALEADLPKPTISTGDNQSVSRSQQFDTKPEPPLPPIPDAITKPLPLTLHGLAPARGKSMQVFSSALPKAAEIQAPRQSTLPLRPVMILGPAPQPQAAAAVPTEQPIRPAAAPAQPEQRSTNGKPRKSEVRVLSVRLREDIKKSEPKPEMAAASQQQREQPKPERVPAQQDLAKPGTKENGVAPAAQSKPVLVEAKPKVQQVAKPVQPLSPPPPPPEPDLLGLPKLSIEAQGSSWNRVRPVIWIGVVGAILAVIVGGILLTSKGAGSSRAAVLPNSNSPAIVEAGAPIATDAGWITDWFTDIPGARQPRHVDVLRGSLTLRDYRMEFQGQIDQQAIGWVFRANNKKNFYVEKVAIVKPGLEPAVALVRFAVIDGKEESRVQLPLQTKVHLDTLYKIRTEVVGQRFTTWIQDQKVDQWTDTRIDAGGVGLYYDNGDSAKLKGTINLVPLKER